MDDMDKIIHEVFQDIRDGRLITGVDSSDGHYFESLPTANGRADHGVQGSSRLPTFMSSAASSDAMFMPNQNEHLSQVTIGPENLARSESRDICCGIRDIDADALFQDRTIWDALRTTICCLQPPHRTACRL